MTTKQEQDSPSTSNTSASEDADCLLKYVSTNKVDLIKSLINKRPELLWYKKFNYKYGRYDDQILAIACNRQNLAVEEATVQELINLGADLYYNHNRALHVAVVNPNPGILQVLIRNKYNINALCNLENTALHTLVVHLRTCKEYKKEFNEDIFVEHVKLMLAAGIDVNRRDNTSNRCTAIVVAAENGFKSIVKTLLDESKTRLELDNCVYHYKTAREWINEKNLYDLTDYEKKPHKPVTISRKDNLFELIKERNEKEFLEMFQTDDNPDEDDGSKTFLEYACDRNCYEIVKFLCEKGASINKTALKEAKKPIYLALSHGNHKIVKVLIERKADVDIELVSMAIKCNDRPYKTEKINYEKCLEILVKSKHFNEKMIHEKDSYGNTLLHNTVMWGPASLTESLLEKGANLGSQNKFMPIQFIDPKILEKHLDSCIEIVKTNNLEENKIVLKLGTLIPEQEKNIESGETLDISSESESAPLEEELDFKRESVVIDFMANSPKLKHLLKHPVIACYLLMKWHRIQFLFYVNLAFYAWFVLSLNAYIFAEYMKWDYFSKLISFVLAVTYLLMFVRELFQFVVSPQNYLFNFENLIEIALLLITPFILINPWETEKQLSAFAIVFSAFELVLMLGQYPKFTTHVMMLKTVSANFFQLFLYSLLLIFAFTFSFSVLFTQPDTLGSQTNSSSNGSIDANGDDKNTTGLGPWMFKTLMLMAGQFDATSVEFKKSPVFSHVFFTMFVVTMIIILMNLLNGLAVSDTQTIKNGAELVGHIARAQFINHLETLIIDNVFKKNSSFIYAIKLFSCGSDSRFSKIYGKVRKSVFLQRLSLFSKKEKNLFLFTQSRSLTLDRKNNEKNGCLADEETVNWANIIAHRKKTDLVADFEQLKAEQNIQSEKIDKLLRILTNISNKMENENVDNARDTQEILP